jgi:hypothetical protein
VNVYTYPSSIFHAKIHFKLKKSFTNVFNMIYYAVM